MPRPRFTAITGAMAPSTSPLWRFAVDRGGTFTDIVGVDPIGGLVTAKLLSHDPERYADAAIEGIRRLTGARAGALPPLELRIGTTIATNALLERAGAPTLLSITKGFGDALRIGYQERPDIFARAIVRPEPLYARVAEIDERVDADGATLVALDHAKARAALQEAHDAGLRAVAIVLMHGWRYPAHEAALAAIAAEIGFTQISASHRVSPSIRLIGRGDTSVADAYLSPVLRAYVAGLSAALGGAARPLFMQSSGGLADGSRFSGKDAILSGPAGGIVGMARTAAAAGFDRVIGFDMGGTSTDVAHFAGEYERASETMVGGSRIRAPMLRIHTVAAGGGSICRIDGGRFTVGPASAGAVPGPACYRRGGPLTVTDCNVALGKLQPDHFPALFGPRGDAPLDAAAVDARFAALAEDMASVGLAPLAPEEAAAGFVAIAVANMANAIRKISVERGHDVAGYALASFGGAGGQHACLVAEALGMTIVLIHPLAGVLSAYGIGLAERATVRDRTLALPFDGALDAALHPLVERVSGEVTQALRDEGVGDAITMRAKINIRYAASDSVIETPLADEAAMRAAFEAGHARRFGFVGDGPLVAELLRIEAIAAGDESTPAWHSPSGVAQPLETVRTFGRDGWADTLLFDRATLPEGFAIDGPALIVDPVATTMIESGWSGRVDWLGNLVLTRIATGNGMHADTALDPVRLEIYNGLFKGLAEEMGAALQQSAASVNIRERLDFSCAIFDAGGALVANAPHIPVHLGSMGDSIRAIVAKRGAARDGRGIRSGDAYALNSPYDGGTHLPDITVVMPVFVEAGDAPAFYVAARGHHADVGGISPGSMPSNSVDVREEGVLIDNLLVMERGRFLEREIRTLLASGDWPARDPDRNVADLQAQIAACARGAEGLGRLAADNGAGVLAAYMAHIQAHAEEVVRALLGRLDDGTFTYEMDDGAMVRVAVTIDRTARSARVDFTGTSAERPSNFNAPRSITRAAVLYVFRTLIDAAVPLNDGCLRPIEIVIPEGSMLSPRFPAAVVAGNVETSQVVTDALFGALGAMAGAQGTMNNFTFGDERHQYYETIAGGAGAGPGFAGADVIQTHMTNSRLTDPEILETRFPVLLEEFSVRAGSGGAGRWRGGDGALRRIRFRAAMQANILANRRRVPPFGLDGGTPGAAGAAWIERADGRLEALASTGSAALDAGDVFAIETPGGGGCGAP